MIGGLIVITSPVVGGTNLAAGFAAADSLSPRERRTAGAWPTACDRQAARDEPAEPAPEAVPPAASRRPRLRPLRQLNESHFLPYPWRRRRRRRHNGGGGRSAHRSGGSGAATGSARNLFDRRRFSGNHRRLLLHQGAAAGSSTKATTGSSTSTGSAADDGGGSSCGGSTTAAVPERARSPPPPAREQAAGLRLRRQRPAKLLLQVRRGDLVQRTGRHPGAGDAQFFCLGKHFLAFDPQFLGDIVNPNGHRFLPATGPGSNNSFHQSDGFRYRLSIQS
jgi:hypothetical protein